MIHEGLVRKALDAVPIDPDERAVLQRTTAVVSRTLTGRALAAWAGVSNPVLLVVGLAWGLYSAFNINAEAAGTPASASVEAGEPVETPQTRVVRLTDPAAERVPDAAR